MSTVPIDSNTGEQATLPELLTAKELAPLIGLTKPSGFIIVGRWKREGKIPAAVDEPNVVRFDLSAVRKALRERAMEAHAER